MKRRILYVEHNRDGTVGGSHIGLLRLVQALDKTRYEPIVAFYRDHSLIPEFRRHAEVVLVDKAPVMKLAPHWRARRRTAWWPVWLALRLYREAHELVTQWLQPFLRAAALLRARRIDLVHLNNSLVHGHEWMLAARVTGARCVVHQKGYGYGAPLNRRFASLVDAIVCMSQDLRRDLITGGIRPADKVVTVYDGIDVEEFRRASRATGLSLREEFGVPAGVALVGIIGNIKEWKGQHVVVQALARVAREHGKVMGFVVGEAGDRPEDQAFYRELRQLVTRLDVEDAVTFAGFRHDVARVMGELDIVIHASTEPEPFGLVVFEGMALGKAVVATDIGGPREMIEDRVSGRLVPPADPAALADCILELLDDDDRRREMGARAQARVIERFGLARFAREVEGVYRSLGV